MNQKQLNRILQLHKEGVPPRTCVLVILQSAFKNIDPKDATTMRDTAETIDKLYSYIHFGGLSK